MARIEGRFRNFFRALAIAGAVAGAVAPAKRAGAGNEEARISRRYSCPTLFFKPGVRIPVTVSAPTPKLGFRVGIGSRIAVDVGKRAPLEGQFLGRLFRKDGESKNFLFYHHEEKRIYLLNLDSLALRGGDGRELRPADLQPVLDPIEQVDEICMGHVGEHLLHQLKLNAHDGEWAKKLEQGVDTEEERSLLFASLSHAYYATPRNNSNFGLVMRKAAAKFDLECKSVALKRPKAPSTLAAIEAKSHEYIAKMKDALDRGYPVAIEYYIGPWMANQAVRVVDVDRPRMSDRRLWLPRASGERSASGHGALLVDYFTTPAGREKFLILDSNWTEPRLFDVEDDVRKRMFSSGMLMHYCHP